MTRKSFQNSAQNIFLKHECRRVHARARLFAGRRNFRRRRILPLAKESCVDLTLDAVVARLQHDFVIDVFDAEASQPEHRRQDAPQGAALRHVCEGASSRIGRR